MRETETLELVDRWQQGDEAAATELFERHAARLIALVRVRLAEAMRRRFDAEDVVQSAFRSFFTGAREGRYLLRHSGDVWPLLVGITLHKLQHRVTKNLAQKRSVAADAFLSSGLEGLKEQIVTPPTAEAVSAVADEIERIMSRLNAKEQRMFELRLEGYTLDEIATDTNRSQRTVRRVMDRVKAELASS